VVGYLRPIKQWNDGKQAEYLCRKTFKVEPIFKESHTCRNLTEKAEIDHTPHKKSVLESIGMV
jgi:hypothetical protein